MAPETDDNIEVNGLIEDSQQDIIDVMPEESTASNKQQETNSGPVGNDRTLKETTKEGSTQGKDVFIMAEKNVRNNGMEKWNLFN